MAKEDVKSLIEDLEGSGGWGKGRKTREKAAMKLGLHGGEEAVLPLIEAFATNHHAPIWPWSSHDRGYESVYSRSLLNVVIRSIEEQIVLLGFEDTVKVELGTDDPHADGEDLLYRDYSIEISPTEVSYLVSMMMGHDDPMVRIGGALIFGECEFYEGRPYPSAVSEGRFTALDPIHPIDYSSIIEAFADEDPRVRWAASHALRREQIRRPEIIWDTPMWTPWTAAIPSLVQALDDSEPIVRWGAAITIGTYLRTTRIFWHSNDEGVFSARVYIDEIDSEEYVGALDDFAIPLRSKLSDPDRRVVLAAVFALGSCIDESLPQHEGCIGDLIHILQDEERDSHVRIESAIALGEIGSERSIDPLIGVLGLTPDEWAFDVEEHLFDSDLNRLSMVAAEALGFADIRAIEPLVKLDMIRPNMFYDHSTRAIDQILANNVASLFPHIDSYEVGPEFFYRSYYSDWRIYPDPEPMSRRHGQWFEEVCRLDDLESWSEILAFLDSESAMQRLCATWLAGYSQDVSGMLDSIKLDDPHPSVRWCALRTAGKLLNNLRFDLFLDGSISYADEFDPDERVTVEDLDDPFDESGEMPEAIGKFLLNVNYPIWSLTHEIGKGTFERRKDPWEAFDRFVHSLVDLDDDSTLVKVELVHLLCKLDELFFWKKDDLGDRALDKILSLCRDEAPLVRRTALGALDGFGIGGIEELRRALSDSGYRVAYTAISILERIRDISEPFGDSPSLEQSKLADDVLNEAVEDGLVYLDFPFRDVSQMKDIRMYTSKFDKTRFRGDRDFEERK